MVTAVTRSSEYGGPRLSPPLFFAPPAASFYLRYHCISLRVALCGLDAIPPKKALLRITPASGPAEAAGTAVTFYGRGFVNTTDLACRFALAPPVPATFVSPNELFCESPPLFSAVDQGGTDDGGLRWSSLSEISQRDSDPLTGSRQLFPGGHYYPLFSQRAVGVEVR